MARTPRRPRSQTRRDATASAETGTLSKLAQAIFHYAVNEPATITRFIPKILATPSKFANTYISDDSDHRLVASFKFYAGVFSVAFLLSWMASQFQFYEGISEIRGFSKLLFQVIVGTTIIYLLLLATRHSTNFPGLLQIILYVDGTYLLVDAALSVLTSLGDGLIDPITSRSSIDAFGTELEKCLSRESWTYWALRGDIVFFLQNDRWRPYDWYRRISDYQSYIVAVPFVFVFALMIRAKYGGRFWLFVFVAAVAFVTAVEARRLLEREITRRISSDSTCHRTSANEVAKKYSVALIAEQLEYKLNNELNRALQGDASKLFLALRGDEYLVSGKLRQAPTVEWPQFSSQVDRIYLSLYCSEIVYWQMMRRINHKLTVSIFHWGEDRLVYWKRFEPEVCLAVGNRREQ